MAKIQNTYNTKYWQGCANRNSHSLLVGMQNATTTLEDSLVISYGTKHTLNITSSNPTPWHLFKRIENLRSHKNLYTAGDKVQEDGRNATVSVFGV